MPPKGFKKPPTTRCVFCGKYLPSVALRGLLRQLEALREELARERPPDREPDRHARMQLMNVQGHLALWKEDEATFCFGHEVKAPKPKPEMDPRGPEGAVEQRKKPGRKPKLQAVPDA